MNSARESLARLRRRARFGIAVEGLGCLFVTLLIYGLLSYFLDRWLELEREYRAALLLSLVAMLVYLAIRRLWRPLHSALADDELAMAVERRDPELRQALVSAVEFEAQLRSGEDRGESESMMRSVVDQVEGRAASIAYARALEAGRVLRFAALIVLTLATGASWFATAGSEARTWAARNLALAERPWPHATELRWVEFDASKPLRIAEREDLRLRIEAIGAVPDRVELRGRFADGQPIERAMDRVGTRRFAATLETLLEDLEVVAVGGDGESPPLRVSLVARPRISELRVRIDYPAYIERPAEELSAGTGDLSVPVGSRLTLTASSSKPLRDAALVFDLEQRMPAELSDDGLQASGSFTAKTSGELRFELLDRDDLSPIAAPQLRLTVLPDAAPEVEFETIGVGSAITAEARIPGLLRLRDDYGLSTVSASFGLRSATEDHEVSTLVFEPAPLAWQDEFRPGSREAELGLVFDLLDLRSPPSARPPQADAPIEPGMLLTLRFEAGDSRRPKAQTGTAEDLHLRIVSREELLEDLQRRQLEQRRELAAVLERELDARSTLSDILSSTADDPRVAEARLRVEALSRQQLALTDRVAGIAGRYRRIVAEMENNRLLEPPVTRGLRDRIVEPLARLGRQALPASSQLVDAFARSGDEADRSLALEAFDRIIARIRALLAEMEHSENLTALIDALRGIIRTEQEVSSRLDELLRETLPDIFDSAPERGRDR